ncbi:Calmodulin (EF-Hand superfamily) [Phytophthora cinnamomi]|uniref:Calmodulin (EF-Hand superfamily) n=1 Tax=Phytophthora cinnamomi TaxID=4785 RepID=UPI003559BDA4|nr:Calmodulin (EF-Hand superfamily) [Phytophthora cinnamomi]
MQSNALVERTYQALMGVVQTTAVSRKVLARPPFTFLHKLLVETLAEYDLFSEHQLQFSAMTTKQAKAAFLTRAIAFVTFVMSAHSERPHISCLLLVSPVQVLAGMSVPDTLEFLLQLCEVCRMPNHDIKDAAAKEVREKGDAQLYSSGVVFRKGLVLIQGIIRSFLRRRVQKVAPRLSGAPLPGRELPMAEGTRFLKELADGRIYNGIIQSVQKNVYLLGYDEDADAQDKVNEIEMKIILEESQRLSAAREGYRLTRNGSYERADFDISLTDLPDLMESAHAPGFIKRVSSRDSGTSLLAPKTSRANMLKRAQSQIPSNPDAGLFKLPSNAAILTRKSTSRGSFELVDESTQARSDNQQDPGEFRRRTSKSNDWQSSLKKMLAEGRDQLSPANSLGPEVDVDNKSQQTEGQDPPERTSAHIPSFPKLGIPGTKPLMPPFKRGSTGSIPVGEGRQQKDQPCATPMAQSNTPVLVPVASRPVPLQRGPSTLNIQRAATIPAAIAASAPSPSPSAVPSTEGMVDTAFAGTYQTTDQRTQEKQAMIRDIVMRIDSYMKRKRLRVIDLFRFCDADGNGSISPEEMIDTLSQMEIQLTPAQARDFLEHIDKDGNGSIDVDEFEELVRAARRNEAQREQLKKELNGPRKQTEAKSSVKYSRVMKAKAKQTILDEFKAVQEEGGDGVNAHQLRALIGRLALPGMTETFVNSIVDRAVEIASGSSDIPSTPTQLFTPPSSPVLQTRSNSKSLILYHHLAKALDELEWTKKANRFLDQSWIRQFDSQLERAIREYELL